MKSEKRKVKNPIALQQTQIRQLDFSLFTFHFLSLTDNSYERGGEQRGENAV